MRTRRTVRILGVAMLVAVLGACQWSMPRFSANGSGHNTVESTIDVTNVSQLALAWSASIDDLTLQGTPVISGDTVFVTASSGELLAFDLTPTACGGATPCAPRWTADAATGQVLQALVADGFVIVARSQGLAAYDAAGVDGCAGSPVVCQPIWTAPVAYAPGSFRGVVVGDLIYATIGHEIVVFDANGTQGCTAGTPRSCSPLRTYRPTVPAWETPTPPWQSTFTAPAVADGVLVVGWAGEFPLYVGGWAGNVQGFDAAGVEGCSGSPAVCTPTWVGTSPGGITQSPAVVDGVVYAGYQHAEVFGYGESYIGNGGLIAFDAAACTADADGACDPAWTGRVHDQLAGAGGVTIADGYAHAVTQEGTAAFPAAGCGAPTCTALRTEVPASVVAVDGAVANGVLFVSGRAYDANGTAGCGGSPVVCQPLWTAPVPLTNGITTIVSNGRVITYGGRIGTTSTQTLAVFELV